MKLNFRSIYAVSKKEFKDNFRNNWFIALTGIFFLLVFFTSLLAGGSGEDSVFGGFEDTVTTLMMIGNFLVPIIAIMLGYSTISGEVENGSIDLVLSYPIRRVELILGKLIGLATVLGLSTLIGLGSGGFLVGFLAGDLSSLDNYFLFIMITILFGLLYLSLSMFASTLTSKRSTSLGIAIVIFFWSAIYAMTIMGIYFAEGHSFSDITGGNFPDWVWKALLLSPQDMYGTAVYLAFDLQSLDLMGFAMEIPSYFNIPLIVGVQLLWVVIPISLSLYWFNKKEI